MSKEKNLVIMNKDVPCVVGEKHRKLAHLDTSLKGPEWVDCLCTTPLGIIRHKNELDAFIVGPAIDRLYEFEKLGLEPEEIELVMKQHDFTIFNRNIELQLENANLRNENQSLQNELRNFKSAIYGLSPANVDRLQKENEMLKEEIESLNKQFGTIVSLSAENERLWGKIQDLNEEAENLTGENEELRNEIADRERVESNLRLHINNLEARFDHNLTLQQVISQQKDDIEELKNKLRRSSDSNLALNKQVEEYKSQVKSLSMMLKLHGVYVIGLED